MPDNRRRGVWIPVDDPTVTHAHVTFSRPWNDTLESEDVGEVDAPVPSDDQVMRAILRAAVALEDSIASYRTLMEQQEPGSHSEMVYTNQIRADQDALAYLRAYFQLDGSDDE